jgi:hypothetical protein
MTDTEECGQNVDIDASSLSQKSGRQTPTSWLYTFNDTGGENLIWMECTDFFTSLLAVPVTWTDIRQANILTTHRDVEIAACEEEIQEWIDGNLFTFLDKDPGVDELLPDLARSVCTLQMLTKETIKVYFSKPSKSDDPHMYFKCSMKRTDA